MIENLAKGVAGTSVVFDIEWLARVPSKVRKIYDARRISQEVFMVDS
jgi:hypothetical protein